jgi:hypothetical protein
MRLSVLSISLAAADLSHGVLALAIALLLPLLALLLQHIQHGRFAVHYDCQLSVAVLQRQQLLHQMPGQARCVLVNASEAVLQPHLLLLLLLLLLLCSQSKVAAAVSNHVILALRLSANQLAAAAAAELHQLLKAMPSSSNGCERQCSIFKPRWALPPADKCGQKKHGRLGCIGAIAC